jgi:hypothetical protein
MAATSSTSPASPTGSMRAIDRLRKAANFEPIKQVISLENGDELEFYTSPLTAAEREKAQRNAKSDSANDYALQLLILKAKDENGQPLFRPGDAAVLKQEVEDEILQQMILKVLRPDEGDDGVDMKSSGS